uniref:Peptidase_M28 domain-containing protein n=1 Tax=Caenorhabditis tropicalis TaxID=1561998 RepID=A0A1I7T988_9PELO
MITVRNRFTSGCNCLKSQNKNNEKMFQKARKTKSFQAKIVAAVLAIIAAAGLVGFATHKEFRSASASPPIKPPLAKSVRELINVDNLRSTLHALTKKAHVAGTENNLRVAEIIKDKMISQGLENVHFNEYNVLLSYPNWTTPNHVEILGEDMKTVHKTTGRSISIIKEEQNDPFSEIQWLAYSAAGVVEGEIVYVNRGTPKDIEHLESMGIDLKDKILLARYSSNFRGNIAKMAVKKGAKGCLIYSDPMQVASMGTLPNQTYGFTDKMPSHAVQRGTVFIGFGDPRTPAFPSIGDLYKEKTEQELLDEKKIPTIPMLPIPYADAKIIFEHMKGDEVIADFKGRMNVTYRYGPGLIKNQKLRMTVHAKNEERKIQNILGYIRGNEEPEKFVLVSNHYDAWTYGAVDPNSGTTTLLEVSRALKAYQNSTGWTPARSILFAHWDAEEYGLIGSTEFSEEYRVQLMRRAVAVVNMDLIGGNQSLIGIANPTVLNVLREASMKVEHPNPSEVENGRSTMYESWKYFEPSRNNRSTHPYSRIPAGGSDHLSFFDYLGIPIVFFVTSSLDAPPTYPLYHTIYETPYLIEKILDPEFKMHKAIAGMFIEIILKFTESKILPYDLKELMDDTVFDYLPRIQAHLRQAQNSSNLVSYLAPGQKQFELLEKL